MNKKRGSHVGIPWGEEVDLPGGPGWWRSSNILGEFSSRNLGKISHFTNIFQMG